MTTPNKGQQVAEDVSALLRARNPLLWITTREEERVEGFLFEAAAAAGYITRHWDVAAGITDYTGRPETGPLANVQDPGTALERISARARTGSPEERCVWIMRDLPPWLSGPAFATTLRQLRNLARQLPGVAPANAQAIVVLTPSGEIPAELTGHATVIDWPLPDRAEIASMLDVLVEQYELKFEEGAYDAAVDAAVGLSAEEAKACYARSLVQLRRIDPAIVANEKKRVIARERVLEWFDPLTDGLEAVGGLDQLKEWLVARRLAYSQKARDYGLPPPKGVLLVGVPGCGKSLTSKAISTAYGVPLLRFDLGALKSKYVGESEGNLRKAFKIIEAIGRCVVWLDEIEKALQGATSGSADGGVAADALGAILSWMQERSSEAFVIATANDVEGLPPELLRKGRFDEVWWVDMPNPAEREQIMSAALRTHNRGKVKIDLTAISQATDKFTGAEIAALVPDALFAAFADGGRELTTKDLLVAAKNVVPLSQTAAEKIARLREWAVGRARPATSGYKAIEGKPRRQVRALDLS